MYARYFGGAPAGALRLLLLLLLLHVAVADCRCRRLSAVSIVAPCLSVHLCWPHAQRIPAGIWHAGLSAVHICECWNAWLFRLQIISMEGYGTDAYLHLNRLGNVQEPLP